MKKKTLLALLKDLHIWMALLKLDPKRCLVFDTGPLISKKLINTRINALSVYVSNADWEKVKLYPKSVIQNGDHSGCKICLPGVEFYNEIPFIEEDMAFFFSFEDDGILFMEPTLVMWWKAKMNRKKDYELYREYLMSTHPILPKEDEEEDEKERPLLNRLYKLVKGSSILTTSLLSVRN